MRDAANGLYAALRSEVSFRRGSLSFDEETKSHTEQIARWLVDPTGKPGLLMMGLCGNGKTTFLRAIARLVEYVTEETLGYSKRSIVLMRTAKEIARIFNSSDKDNAEQRSLFSEEMLGIDDLGEEPKEVMSYGMIYTPMIDVLSERYNRQLFTIATTNLNREQLSEKYGPRIYDRFKEMMTIIPFTNPSYRK